MKKINTAIFITALAVCLAGCGDKAKDDKNSKADTSSAAETSAATDTEVTPAEEELIIQDEMPTCDMTVTTTGSDGSTSSENLAVKNGDLIFEDADGHWYIPEINENEEYVINAETDQPIATIFDITDDSVTVNFIEIIGFDETRAVASTFTMLDDINFSHQMTFKASDKSTADSPVCLMTITTAYGGTDADGNELESGSFSEDFEVKAGDLFLEDPEGHWYVPEINEDGEYQAKNDFDVPIIEIKEVSDGKVSVNLVDTVNYGETRDVASNYAQDDNKFIHQIVFAGKSE